MKTEKVEGSLVKDSGGSRLRHKKMLLPTIIVILFSVVSIFGYRENINYQLNSEEFSNAHATIEQLSEKYDYVDEYSLTVEELIEAIETDDDVTDDILNKISYLDRQDFSGEDYVKYIDVRYYYENIMYLPYRLTGLSIVLTTFSLAYIVMLIKS